MNYKVDILKQEVRIALDQNRSSEALIVAADIDTLTVEQIIESKIEDAARVITRDAPVYLLDGGVSLGKAEGDKQVYSVNWFSRVGLSGGWIELPNDFLRLVSFQMSDWSRAVTTAITEDNPLYAQQSSRYAGIRGCPQNPVVALVSSKGGLSLEFYSCTAGEGVTVKKGEYIPMPKIANGDLAICEKLKPAVVYYTAYLVALTLGQADLAATMLNVSKELLQ
jgi:hypothetical protein